MKKVMSLALCVMLLASCTAVNESSASASGSTSQVQSEVTTSSGYPEPVLTMYPSDFVYDNNTDSFRFKYSKGSWEEFYEVAYGVLEKEGVLFEKKTPAPIMQKTFASDAIFAGVWDENGTIYVGVTMEDSDEWSISSFVLPDVKTESSIMYSDFGFTTSQDGWLTAYNATEDRETRKGFLFTTGDGGATWGLVNTFEQEYLYGITFASPSVGWMSSSLTNGERSSAARLLYETNNGGKSW